MSNTHLSMMIACMKLKAMLLWKMVCLWIMVNLLNISFSNQLMNLFKTFSKSSQSG